jgi:hypothetical protein
LEQLELISTISQSLQRGYQQAQFSTDFWQPKTLAQLIQAQPTSPLKSVRDLKAGYWPEDESADDVIEYLHQQRREDRLRD